ncbi:MAG: YitT family protein [Corallococcus sp.]|nr:YitT family protein [Corallococcus sp.]
MTKSNALTYLKQTLKIIAAAFLSAFSLEVFLIPSDVIVGGVSGIASMLDIALSADRWYLSAGVWIFAINIPVFVYCFVKYTRRFAVRTLVYVTLLTGFLLLFRLLGLADSLDSALNTGEGGADKVLFTVIGGAIQGLSLPIMLSINGSTGGSDVCGLIIQQRGKRSSSEGLRAILVANVIIVAVSSVALYFLTERDVTRSLNMLIYSIAAIFIGEIVQERVFKGFSSAILLEITTDKPKEMSEQLREQLHHGTTTVKVVGGYTRKKKAMVICVLQRRQLSAARRIIRRVDDKAFAYVENVKEVIGKGFVNKEEALDDGAVEQLDTAE